MPVALFVLLLSLSANAQTPQKPNTDSALDNRMRSGATVDPLSLSLQLSINLGSYPGRDGLALPITMNYSSHLWGIHHVTTDKCGGFPPWTYYHRYRPEYGRGSMAGWTSPLGMSDWIGTVNLETYDIYGHPVSTGIYKKIARMFATLPDGSRHELRKDDSLHDPAETITGKFYAVDDSRLVYDTTTSTLYLPDGTRMASGFIDKNGNKLLRGGSLYTDWTDTMGRSISSPLDTGSNEVGDDPSAVAFDKSFSVPGFNGGTLSYTMKWKKLEDVLTNTSDTLEYMGDTGNSGTCGAYYPPTSPSLFVSTGDETQVMMSTRVFNPVVLAEIDLPNGKSYKFTYNIYGEIDKVVYPTGAYDKFAYDEVEPLNPGLYDGDVFFTQTNRGVISRTQSEDGTTATEVTWTYGQVGRGVTNPDGTYSSIGVYPGTFASAMKWGFESVIAGLPSVEYTYNSSGTMLTRHIIDRTYDSVTVGGVAATRNPRVTREISVKFEPGDSNALVSLVTYDYDSNSNPAYFANLNPTVVKQYNYVVVSASTAQTASSATLASYFSGSAPAKQVETDYLYDSNYLARNLTQVPTEVRIKDGSGNVKAKTHFYYDESGYQLSSSGTMPTAASGTWTDPLTELGSTIGAIRALPTTIRSYYDITNGYYIDTHKFYDQYGNVTKVRDGRGNDTTTTFADTYAFTLPTSVTTPIPDSSGTHGSSTAFTSSTAYDYSSGLPTSTTDINGRTTTVSYADPSTSVVDPLLRPRVVTAANGQQTITEYGDTSGSLYVKVSSQIDSSNWKVGYKYFDNLGRTIRTRSVDPAGDDYTLMCYDNMGRVSKMTNPFRGYSTQTCSTTTGLDWTSMTYDAEGRVTAVATADTAQVTTAYALATSGSPIGTAVMVTEQASKSRKSVTDALGRLTTVYEDPASLNYATSYSYDTLDNLTGVTQGSQTRTFAYDSLRRLTSATNPESGTITYGYDNNGNLTSKTDPRTTGGSNWATAIAYDALNRIITKSYSNDGGVTPPVNYYYDNASLPSGAPSFTRGYSTGRLVAVTYGASSSNGTYRGYDELGRVVRQYQQTDGVNYLTEATYYLNSAMASETYPSVPGASDRRTVSYSLDSAARLSSLSSSATMYAPAASVSSIAYAPHSALTSESYGNGLIHAVTYNNRLQPNEIKLGTSGSPASIVDLTYSYGTTTNNGNVQSMGYTGGGLSYTQSFGYDSLNRLTTSSESGSAWSQTNAYDRYGNRQIDYGGGSYNLAFSATTNRITTSGYSYDAAGNLTNDTVHAYTFDAENKILKVDTVSAYTYDGEGQRVRKLVGENLRFIYGIGGQEIAEFSGASGALQKEYIYGASGLLATIEPTAVNANGTRYTTADNLGTPRVVTNASAGVVSRHDYRPFGEEMGSGVGGRTTGMGYSVADGVRQRFTSKERDNETGLDYFGARYYGSTQGRFSSVDPKMLGVKQVVNPQRWNRYAYVVNNPLALYDPDGQDDQGKGGSKVIDIFLWYDKVANPKGEDRMTNEQTRQLSELRRQATAKNIQINVHEKYDADADSAARAAATPGAIVIFGVHTARDQATQETIGPNTMTGPLGRAGIINTDENGRYVATPTEPTRADLVVVMGCDSSYTRDAFAGAANYIGVNGGQDHASSTFGLNQGIIETVRTIVNANGVINTQTVNNIVTNTQNVIRNNPAQGNPDPDDRVIANPAMRVPTPGRRVP